MKTIAAAAIAGIVLTASPAQATDSSIDGDTRHCVTAREAFLPPGGLTRAQVERRWEAEGRGERRRTILGVAWVYDMCDRGPDWIAFAMYKPGVGSWLYGITDAPTEPLGS